MNLSLAQEISSEVITLLEPYCTFIQVAGSTRRKCAEVGDIEIVLQRRNKDLIRFKEIIDSWTKIAGDATGRQTKRYYRKNGQDYQIDIYMPQPNDLWRQFAIRTGSANYSHKVIANGWVKLGWVGTPDGLRLVSQCETKGDGHVCKVKNPTLPPVWKDERDFFKFLNIAFVEPENRI